MPKNDIQTLLDAAVHFGHKTQKWNPKMKSFLYGSRNGIHIFDLQKTQDYLTKALEYVKNASAMGKVVLFVSTKPQAAQYIVEAAEACKMPYVIHKWLPGLLTNFSTMKQRIRYFKSLRDQEKSGELEKYTKKEISVLRKEMVKLEEALGGVKDLDRLPDIVFLADIVRDRIVVKEANKMKIPVVGIADSNADPDGIFRLIPGNDDAVKSLEYLIKAVETAFLEGKKAGIKN